MKMKDTKIKMTPEVMKKFSLMERQVMLMQTFVDDLLDLQQIKNGVFKLVDGVFDPNEILDLICTIFAP